MASAVLLIPPPTRPSRLKGQYSKRSNTSFIVLLAYVVGARVHPCMGAFTVGTVSPAALVHGSVCVCIALAELLRVHSYSAPYPYVVVAPPRG